MNIRFVDKNAKDMAAAIPVNHRKSQIASCEEVIATAIRMTRGSAGQLMQRTKTVFGTWVERVEPYPHTISEDDPEKPNIKLAIDPNHETVIWFMQSAGNQKFLITYYTELCKLTAVDTDGATMAAYKATEWPEFEYKGKTPPPSPASKTAADYRIEEAHRKDLHRVKVEWSEEQKPKWFMSELNETLTKKKEKQA